MIDRGLAPYINKQSWIKGAETDLRYFEQSKFFGLIYNLVQYEK